MWVLLLADLCWHLVMPSVFDSSYVARQEARSCAFECREGAKRTAGVETGAQVRRDGECKWDCLCSWCLPCWLLICPLSICSIHPSHAVFPSDSSCSAQILKGNSQFFHSCWHVLEIQRRDSPLCVLLGCHHRLIICLVATCRRS
jgi:hypothetical protein